MAEPEYHPEASDEVANAFAHYASVNSEVGERFKLELDRAEKLVQRSPDSWGPYFHGTQGFRFRGFPFVMAYIVRDERIIVIAVAHTRRTPGYGVAGSPIDRKKGHGTRYVHGEAFRETLAMRLERRSCGFG